MPRITNVQAAFTYGVLDPHIIERRDTKFIAGSLSDGRNIILLPQGGLTDRGGTTDFGRARKKLTAIAINTTILSLPNGGSETDLLAGIAITTGTVATTRYVLFQCDFVGATLVHMIDIRGLKIATTPADNALIAEYWNGAAWVAFAPAQKITLAQYSRRFASGAPGHAGITATKFRVCVDATTAAGTVQFSGISLLAENATRSDGIVRRYAPEQGMAHQFVLTDGNVDFYEGGVWRAAASIPIGESIIRTVKFEAKYDSILAFEQNLQPRQILRLGSSTEWACDPVVFENLPLVDYGGTYTNGINAKQNLVFYDLAGAQPFDITVEGQTTSTIVHSDTDSVLAANVKAALEALSTVEPGLTVTSSGNGFYVQVEFTGGGNANREWLRMTGTSQTNQGFIQTQVLEKGKAPGEDIISNARGWPAVGRYAQQRLIMGGLKGRPNDVLASVTGDPFNLNTEVDIATRAFSYEIDSSENNAIRDIFVGRTLMFYGDQQLSFLKNAVLSADEAPQFGSSDAPGLKATTSPVSSDSAIFHIQEGGTTLRMTSYTELEQNFVADNASVLSAFLIKDPTELFRRRALGSIDTDLMVMVNADGSATALTLMRTQEVSGYAPWTTDGAFRSGCTDHDNVVWFLVDRQVNGVTELRLEKMEPEKLLDEAIEITQASSVTVPGLSRFNGRTVYAVANNSVYGPFVVGGGTITLPEAATQIRVGTWIAPLATDPEVSLTEESRARMARLKRVNRAELSVMNTTSLAISANDGPVINVPLRSNDDTFFDEGPLARPFTGKVEAEGMHGFTEHGRLTVTQIYPGFLTVRSVTKSVVA
ncbi:hypothetical protein MCHK_3004 [Mesorhizobium huakuii 7653R]|nr:hypothetical protein MCHK_3004 [Mesorhizobium huakuii 7653R]